MSPDTLSSVLTAFSFDAASGTYRANYDPEATRPSTAVVALLARVLETSPIEIDQLQYSVDTEALNALFAPKSEPAAVEISFTFNDYDITVYSGKLIAKAIHYTEEATDL